MFKHTTHSLVNWYIEEALNLGRMQVHCLQPQHETIGADNTAVLSPICIIPPKHTYNDMITTRLLNHVRYQLRRDGRSTLVFLVLSGIWKERNNGRYSLRACNFACMYHDAKLHEGGVNLSTSCVDDIDILLSHRFDYANMSFTDSTLGHFCFSNRQTKAAKRNK